MALFNDASIVADMAMLSLAAYAASLKQDRDFHPDLTDGWSPLNGIQGDIVKGSYANGVYRHDYSLTLVENTAVAIVARKGSELAISFRGSADDERQNDDGTTSILDDWAVAADDQSAHFKALREVIDAALKYAADRSNGITKVYVTGHSLGAAMAEYVAARYSLFEDVLPGAKVQFVTFGSPGVDRADANPLGLSVEQIGHSKDPIFEQDVPIFDLSGLTRAEDRITVHLPFVPGGLLDFPQGFTPQHKMTQYFDTAGALAGSPLDGWADREFYIAVGREKAVVSGIDRFGKATSPDDQFLIGRNGQEVLTGSSGGDLLDGGGSADTLRGGTGDDRLNGGLQGDVLNGGGGFDYAHYNGATQGVIASLTDPSINTGEARGDRYALIEGLYGSKFADQLTGDAGANALIGRGGKDALAGRFGNDTLDGQGGNDRFLFNTALNALTNVDTVEDFEVASDRIVLARAIFANLGPGATLAPDEFHVGPRAVDAENRIIYNFNMGGLFYDADGSGSRESVRFASLDDGLALANTDFLVS